MRRPRFRHRRFLVKFTRYKTLLFQPHRACNVCDGVLAFLCKRAIAP